MRCKCPSSKFWLIIVTLVLSTFWSGIIYGWPALELILKAENIYADQGTQGQVRGGRVWRVVLCEGVGVVWISVSLQSVRAPNTASVWRGLMALLCRRSSWILS